MSFIHIDGSHGEGGGQVLRSSLALALITGKPFRIENIRAGRKKPGLMRQHLTAVNAAVQVGCAEVTGARVGSTELQFAPHRIESGKYHFAVGTAGSCTLVLQTVLPALMIADGESELVLEGGTHNPFAPPFDFLAKAFIPVVNQMGPEIRVHLERPGFYPAGGGRFTVHIKPSGELKPLELPSRGEIKTKTARGIVSRLPKRIANTETSAVCEVLGWPRNCCLVEEAENTFGPGNILTVEIESEHITEVFTGFGRRGVPAKEVGQAAANAVKTYLDSEAPVGPYLADQLMIPFVMAKGGFFRTMPLSRHAETNIDVIKQFLDLEIKVTEPSETVREVRILTDKG